MIKVFRYVIVACVFAISSLIVGHTVLSQNEKRIVIEGVYTFASELTEIEQPAKSTESRRTPEWQGLIFFLNGRYSLTLMQSTRESDWLTSFPKNLKEMGFESSAGVYYVKDRTVTLVPDLMLHPYFDGRSRTFSFEQSMNGIVLTEEIKPRIEDITKGKRTIVLKSVRSVE